MKKLQFLFAFVALLFVVEGCGVKEGGEKGSDKLSIDFKKYELENGLQVILHQDHSDPIVSLAVLYHVGSNREHPGKTGFAHLFEHMLFQQSEHIGEDQFFKIIQDAGGTLNGGTFQDGTIYYEIVPKNALELILWMESDRMGFFKNTITRAAFANQQEVVINEKRQRVDNNPFGHTMYVINKAIFPEGHPYNWEVIGEMKDLKNATVDDVREFYDNFYGPNNATLVLAGDFEEGQAKALIEKYFGEIKRGPDVPPIETPDVKLAETKKLYHEDNFANTAQLNMVWPTVKQYEPDAYALDFLAKILSDGKKAPLYKVLVKEKNLTSRTAAFNRPMQLAGMFRIVITANDGVSLNDVNDAIFEAFDMFEKEGITDTDLERVKAGLETDFYNGLQSVLYKSFQLAMYNAFAGDPGFISQDIENIRKVTKEDVLRVYEKYIKNKPYVVTSFVPKGKPDLIVEGSEKAEVVEEKIGEEERKEVAEAEEEEIKQTPSAFDRSIQPETGPLPRLNLPQIWTGTLDNGIRVYGIENTELPLIQFTLVLEGGHLLDDMNKIGVANLMTDIMMEGTATKTPEDLEEEIDLLGSNIYMYTSNDQITISGNTLARNFGKTMDIIEELLFEPRWDEEEFERIKTKTINDNKRKEASPNRVPSEVFRKLVYGTDHIFAYPLSGSVEAVESITIDDLKAFYDKYYSPGVARFHIVGNISKEEALTSLNSLNEKWKPKEVTMPDYPLAEKPEKAMLYFIDFPDAKQSVINIGYLALARTDPDYYPATVMNYKLGGSFSGVVNMILREEKGYTYGARTYFSGSKIPGPFTASSSVRTNATLESVNIFKEAMQKYREGISEEDLEFTRNAMIKSNARRFETLGAKLNILSNMGAYDFPPDYIRKEEDIVRNMTLEQHKALAQKYIIPERMIYVVAGDAKTQFGPLKSEFEKALLVDKEGNPVE